MISPELEKLLLCDKAETQTFNHGGAASNLFVGNYTRSIIHNLIIQPSALRLFYDITTSTEALIQQIVRQLSNSSFCTFKASDGQKEYNITFKYEYDFIRFDFRDGTIAKTYLMVFAKGTQKHDVFWMFKGKNINFQIAFNNEILNNTAPIALVNVASEINREFKPNPIGFNLDAGANVYYINPNPGVDWEVKPLGRNTGQSPVNSPAAFNDFVLPFIGDGVGGGVPDNAYEFNPNSIHTGISLPLININLIHIKN